MKNQHHQPVNEAAKIYFAIFEKEIPLSLKQHFDNISKKTEVKYTEAEITKYHKYIDRIDDLEALEVSARYLKKLPILTEKFKIMIFLGETQPVNYSVFINEQTNRFIGFILLMSSVLRTAYKFAKGVFLLIVHRS